MVVSVYQIAHPLKDYYVEMVCVCYYLKSSVAKMIINSIKVLCMLMLVRSPESLSKML